MTSTTVRPRMLPLLLAWLLLWVVIVATWLYDGQGYTVGMPGPVFLLVMLGPLLVGLVLGWGAGSFAQAAKLGMLGGVAYGLANMVGQLVWGGVLRLLGRLPPGAIAESGGWGMAALEVVEFTLLFTLTGLVLGLVGGLLGAGLSRLRR